jgi:hypothetical protein
MLHRKLTASATATRAAAIDIHDFDAHRIHQPHLQTRADQLAGRITVRTTCSRQLERADAIT